MTTNLKELMGWGDKEIEDLRYLGYAYAREGVYETAQSIFEGILAIEPDGEYDNQTIGAIYLEKGMNEEARVALERALQINPNHTDTVLNHTKSLFLLGRIDEASAKAKKLQGNQNMKIASEASSLLLAYT